LKIEWFLIIFIHSGVVSDSHNWNRTESFDSSISSAFSQTPKLPWPDPQPALSQPTYKRSGTHLSLKQHFTAAIKLEAEKLIHSSIERKVNYFSVANARIVSIPLIAAIWPASFCRFALVF